MFSGDEWFVLLVVALVIVGVVAVVRAGRRGN